jgi:hypothetical protein
MILLRLFKLVIGILTGLILIPALIIGTLVLFGFCLLLPLWFPIVIVIAGAAKKLLCKRRCLKGERDNAQHPSFL